MSTQEPTVEVREPKVAQSFRKVVQKPNKPVAGFELYSTVYRAEDGREIFLGAPTEHELAAAFRQMAGYEPDCSRFQFCVLVQRDPAAMEVGR